MRGEVLHAVLQGTPRNVKAVAVPGTTCSATGTLRNVKGVAVLVALHVVLHVVLQGTLRNVKGVAELQRTLQNV